MEAETVAKRNNLTGKRRERAGGPGGHTVGAAKNKQKQLLRRLRG